MNAWSAFLSMIPGNWEGGGGGGLYLAFYRHISTFLPGGWIYPSLILHFTTSPKSVSNSNQSITSLSTLHPRTKEEDTTNEPKATDNPHCLDPDHSL